MEVVFIYSMFFYEIPISPVHFQTIFALNTVSDKAELLLLEVFCHSLPAICDESKRLHHEKKICTIHYEKNSDRNYRNLLFMVGAVHISADQQRLKKLKSRYRILFEQILRSLMGSESNRFL